MGWLVEGEGGKGMGLFGRWAFLESWVIGWYGVGTRRANRWGKAKGVCGCGCVVRSGGM